MFILKLLAPSHYAHHCCRGLRCPSCHFTLTVPLTPMNVSSLLRLCPLRNQSPEPAVISLPQRARAWRLPFDSLLLDLLSIQMFRVETCTFKCMEISSVSWRVFSGTTNA